MSGSLGGQFLLWEHAVALAGRLLGINPFDQPDVESAKQATRDLLASAPRAAGRPAPATTPRCSPTVRSRSAPRATAAGSARRARSPRRSRRWWTQTPERGYLAIQAYLDRLDDASFETLRPELAKATGLQTTFGWGPRFLHSTGQYHKGGHQNGAFLQVTGSVADDLAIPGQPFSFGTLEHAQAIGDAGVLAAPKNGAHRTLARPVLRLHLADRAAGLVALAHAVREVSR